jgi:hypothetical protein
MYCRNCGVLNDDNAWKCVRCGQVLPHGNEAGMPAEPISNHLVEAILVTLFCCIPFGIVAIVFAAQVNSKIAAGDVQGALDASHKAQTWTWVSFICGLIPAILGFLVVIFQTALGFRFGM